MKRFYILILSIFLSLSMSINVFASDVDGLEIISSCGIDPRYDDSYADYFDMSLRDGTDLSDYPYQCSYVVKRYVYNSDSDAYNELYSYGHLYSKHERLALVITTDADADISSPNRCYAYFYWHNTNQNGNYLVSCANENINGTFWCCRTGKTSGTFFGFTSGATSYLPDINSSASLSASYIEVVECDVPIFSNNDDALYYYNTGVIRNALYDPTINYDGDNLYFKSFDVFPHYSSDYDRFYFDVKYVLSDYAINNIDKLSIRLDNFYECSISSLSGGSSGIINLEQALNSEIKSNNIALDNFPNGFKIYLSDVASLRFFLDKGIRKQMILGNEGIIDFDSLSIQGLGLSSMYHIDTSILYFQFYIRGMFNGRYVTGPRNDFCFDFISKNKELSLYEPDAESYLPNQTISYTQTGETSTSNEYYSNEGDKYYYYDSSGNKTEIDYDTYNNSSFNINASGGNASASGGSASAVIGDVINNIDINIDNGGHGDYVDISPTDFSLFVDSIKQISSEVQPEGGLYSLVHDTYSLFPDDILYLIEAALSAVILVSIICIVRR